jgi:hypothetical protein
MSIAGNKIEPMQLGTVEQVCSLTFSTFTMAVLLVHPISLGPGPWFVNHKMNNWQVTYGSEYKTNYLLLRN